MAGQTFHKVFCGSQLIRGNKRHTEQWASTGRRIDCLSRQIYSLIGPKYPAKFENDCISRSAHRFKITQQNLTILVSLSSAEDVLSNDVKKYDIFGLHGTENPPFHFFWDTRYIIYIYIEHTGRLVEHELLLGVSRFYTIFGQLKAITSLQSFLHPKQFIHSS